MGGREPALEDPHERWDSPRHQQSNDGHGHPEEVGTQVADLGGATGHEKLQNLGAHTEAVRSEPSKRCGGWRHEPGAGEPVQQHGLHAVGHSVGIEVGEGLRKDGQARSHRQGQQNAAIPDITEHSYNGRPGCRVHGSARGHGGA